MHNVPTCLARLAVLFCDSVNTADAVIHNLSNSNAIRKANLVNQVVILGCVITDLYMQTHDTSLDALQGEKIFELVFRVSGGILSVANEETLGANQPDRSSRVADKVFAALAGFVSTIESAEINKYHYLSQMNDQELAKLRADTLANPYDESPLPPSTHKECVALETGASDALVATTMLRSFFEQKMGHKLRAARNPSAPPVQNPPQAIAQQVAPIPAPTLAQQFQARLDAMIEQMEEDALRAEDARTLGFIPKKFYDDALFSQRECAICHIPVRDPVQDPGTGRIYERLAIQAWVALAGTSPMNQPHRVSLADLVEMPELKNRITAKLNYLLRQEAEFRASAPFQAALARTEGF